MIALCRSADADTRTGLVAPLVAIGAAGGLAYTARTCRLARESHITDRYSTAVAQLGRSRIRFPFRPRSTGIRAALLGTALAAVVALSFSGQGEWDRLGAGAGIALLVVLGRSSACLQAGRVPHRGSGASSRPSRWWPRSRPHSSSHPFSRPSWQRRPTPGARTAPVRR